MKILLIAATIIFTGTAVADVYENGADYRRKMDLPARVKSMEEQRFLFLRTLEDDLRKGDIAFTVMGFKMLRSKYPDLRELGAKILQDSSKTYNNFLVKQEGRKEDK